MFEARQLVSAVLSETFHLHRHYVFSVHTTALLIYINIHHLCLILLASVANVSSAIDSRTTRGTTIITQSALLWPVIEVGIPHTKYVKNCFYTIFTACLLTSGLHFLNFTLLAIRLIYRIFYELILY